MGFKFRSKDASGKDRYWNLSFGHGTGEVVIPDSGDWVFRDYTKAYLTDLSSEEEYEGLAIHRPSEPFNKETARVYAILSVLEQAGLTLRSERMDFFEAYRQAKAAQVASSKKSKPGPLDVYVSE